MHKKEFLFDQQILDLKISTIQMYNLVDDDDGDDECDDSYDDDDSDDDDNDDDDNDDDYVISSFVHIWFCLEILLWKHTNKTTYHYTLDIRYILYLKDKLLICIK